MLASTRGKIRPALDDADANILHPQETAMGSVQPLPEYIKWGFGLVIYSDGHLGWGYGWYVDYAANPQGKPE
jgi:hypothetical protein